MQKFIKLISVLLITSLVTSPPAFSGGGFSGGSGGEVSDDAYGAGWNGVTTVAPSKNAVYDKVETIVAGGLDFALDSSSSGNIVYVGCSDSISSAITAASAGDTIELGACTYTLTSGLTVNKALTIKGQGDATVLNSVTSGITMITVTADGFHWKDMRVTGTLITKILFVDATAGATFQDISVDNVNGLVTFVNTVTGYSVHTEDSSIVIRNSRFISSMDSPGVSVQDRNLAMIIDSTAEAATTVRLENVYSESTVTNGSSSGNLSRGILLYNRTGASPSTQVSYFNNVYFKSTMSGDTSAISQAVTIEGALLTSNMVGTTLDGGTGGASTSRNDLRCETGTCNLYGTVLVNGRYITPSGGTINSYGSYYGGSVVLTGLPAPDASPTTASAAENVITITAPKGGDSTGTGTRSGGAGSSIVVTLGAGGVADSANTASTGGAGGARTYTLGVGGAASVAGTTRTGGAGGADTLTGGVGGAASGGTTNNAGRGSSFVWTSGAGGAASGGTTATAAKAGDISILGGTGGNASGAGTTNTGGDGADLFFLPGAAGTGATANGVIGNIYLLANSAFTNRGTVQVYATAENPVDTANQKLEVNIGSGISRYSATVANGPSLWFNRARGTQASPTIISSGDTVGIINFNGYDGNSWESTAAIAAIADTTVSDGNMPTALKFYTGLTTSQGLKMTLSSAGDLGLGTIPGTFGTAERFEVLSANSQGPLTKYIRSDTTVSSGEVIGGQYYYNNDSSLTTQNIYASVAVEALQTISTDAAAANYKVSVTGTTAGGAPVLRHETNERGFLVAMPAAQTIADTNTIAADACGGVKNITSAGAVTTSTTNTFTATPSTSSCVMNVINTGSNNIVLDNNADFHTASGADLTLAGKNSVIVAWNGTDWYQMSEVVDNT